MVNVIQLEDSNNNEKQNLVFPQKVNLEELEWLPEKLFGDQLIARLPVINSLVSSKTDSGILLYNDGLDINKQQNLWHFYNKKTSVVSPTDGQFHLIDNKGEYLTLPQIVKMPDNDSFLLENFKVNDFFSVYDFYTISFIEIKNNYWYFYISSSNIKGLYTLEKSELFINKMYLEYERFANFGIDNTKSEYTKSLQEFEEKNKINKYNPKNPNVKSSWTGNSIIT